MASHCAAHHELYEKAGILHHDISVNNLMVDAHDHSVGVLIDLDLAVQLKDGDTILHFDPVPGGTIPFRARGILNQNEPITTLYYRYDLESFFYTLLWILAFYPFDFSTTIEADYSKWSELPPQQLAIHKAVQLFDMSLGGSLPDGPLKERWLVKLAKLFYDGYRHPKSKDAETLNGRVTYSNFMSILNENDVEFPASPSPSPVWSYGSDSASGDN